MFYWKQGNIFWWISYETYCLKVSLNNNLILSQFSQKEITIFFLFKWTKKPKFEEQKENSYLQFVSPKRCFVGPWSASVRSMLLLRNNGNENGSKVVVVVVIGASAASDVHG